MNSTTVTLRLRLARPPVVRVRTTIYFAEVEDLTLSELAPFVAEMSQSYPSISEQFPLPPIGDDGSDVGFAKRSSGLPMPLVSMVADSGNEISFQADRLGLSWNFDLLKPDKIYPGFELLREELLQALAYRDDGMSVAIGELMQHQLVEVSDLVDFARHAVARCGVIDIRAAAAGIIASVDERDENEGLGRAHGLVRTDAPPPDRERWALVRDQIRRKMSLCDSPALEWVHTS